MPASVSPGFCHFRASRKIQMILGHFNATFLNKTNSLCVALFDDFTVCDHSMLHVVKSLLSNEACTGETRKAG